MSASTNIRIWVSKVFIYAWFLIVNRLIWWSDFAFLYYDGPSIFLDYCSFAGIVGLWTVGMLPVGFIVHSLEKSREAQWTRRDSWSVLMCSTAIAFCGLVVSFVFGIVGYLVHWFSEDAANIIFRYMTIFRDP